MTDAVKLPRTPEAADARFAASGGDESLIPEGSYCYRVLGFTEAKDGQPPRMHIEPCPYWGAHPDKSPQSYGYCAKLGQGDWEDDGPFLLWDQVKECGIGEFDEEEEDANQEEMAAMREAADQPSA